jgi:hypothetical protein
MDNIGTSLLVLVMFWILAAWIGGFFRHLKSKVGGTDSEGGSGDNGKTDGNTNNQENQGVVEQASVPLCSFSSCSGFSPPGLVVSSVT